MAHLTNFSFEFFYALFTEDASQLFLYPGAKKSKMTKNSNQRGGGGGPALISQPSRILIRNDHDGISRAKPETIIKRHQMQNH